MQAIQSILFVPGNRPERFAKALASGADMICLDLEDAVPPDEKSAARNAALAVLGDDARLAVRINGLATRDGLADLLALAEAPARPAMLLIPMVESTREITIARSILVDSAVNFVPLIETVSGIANAPAIAAETGVSALMFGGADLSAQLGVTLGWEPLLLARSKLVMAAAGAGKWAIDVPYIHLDDETGLADEAQRAKALGFTAKAAIHPAQIPAIHGVFRPTAHEIAEAARGAAVRFKGKMLEAPVMARYRQILSLKDRFSA
jgi:(S)-citramalyl-CoA lyase